MDEKRSFCLWSGGKDCCLALHEAILKGYRVELLVTLLEKGGRFTTSHGIPLPLLESQASNLGVELLALPRNGTGGEHPIITASRAAVARGCHYGIFGDIFVEAHRDWILRIAEKCRFLPVFPLWNRSTDQLARNFLRFGFQALVISVKKDVLGGDHLGRVLDEQFLEMLERKGIDPCGENGEYHTFVFDGPIFNKPVPFDVTGVREERGHLRLQLVAQDGPGCGAQSRGSCPERLPEMPGNNSRR